MVRSGYELLWSHKPHTNILLFGQNVVLVLGSRSKNLRGVNSPMKNKTTQIFRLSDFISRKPGLDNQIHLTSKISRIMRKHSNLESKYKVG